MYRVPRFTMATVTARKIKTLTAKKESLFCIIQKLYDLTKTLNTPAHVSRFKTLYRSIETTRREINLVIEQIVEFSLEEDENYIPDFKILRTIDELCCHVHDAAEKLKDADVSAAGPSGPVASAAVAKLPKIELPQFSGEIREWETFYSIFKSLIHDNNTLTNADKVHYLVGRLKGSALGICSGLAPTGDNYAIIWQSLVDKYQNKRALANSYLDQIMEFRGLHNESSKNLGLFLEKFDAAVKALKNLQIADLTDFILGYQALSKLDSETVKAFEMSRRSSDIPTYEEIIKFVKEQSNRLGLNKKPAIKYNTVDSSNKYRPAKSFIVNNVNPGITKSGNTCIYCHKGWHFLGRCEKFKRLSPGKRYETVRDNNWCYNCLSPVHGVRSCPSERNCTECGKRHHILLHTGRSSQTGMERTSGVSNDQAGSSQENNSIKGVSAQSVENAGFGNAETLTNLCSTASVDLFAEGKFDLTKWSTNSLNLLEHIPIEKRLSQAVVFKTDTKILGMQCYDPIGLIAPFILHLKLLVKELWRLHLDWDSEPPTNILRCWAKLHDEWDELSNIQIPRHVCAENNLPVMLIGFADASQEAYGSVVYLRTLTSAGNIEVRLVCAKSKVSPFKRVTIPKLELCAVTLLSKLLKHVISVYSDRIVITKTYSFSDSTTVLQWLNTSYLKDIFVANRIGQIRENLPNTQWRHVSGTENPADCLSRGLSPSHLINHALWYSGPTWLKLEEKYWPVKFVGSNEELYEANSNKADILLVSEIENHPLYDLILRHSSWGFILRTTVWVLRFFKNNPP
ncbi:hypothetical protein NQ317_019892 [Molorchus minor]|uniref:Uncharacterized protein n=1 Tax=Molorchus minor TaxID=1323400 RepID=A0ABQ9IV03_9CUCU|nr:hypothetical protein NQ317_019892 [Molorchus minor]